MKNTYKIINLTIVATILLLATSCASKKDLAYSQPVYVSEKNTDTALESRVKFLDKEVQKMNEWNVDLRNLNEELVKKLEAARASLHQVSKQDVDCPHVMKEGVVFKVQIGAFKVREISDDLTTPSVLDTEKEGEVQKVIVGQFRDYYKAELLKAHIKAMGIEDAWVVSYKDGQRVAIHTVMPN